MSDDRFDDDAGAADREIDGTLSEAGARWRASQPPAGRVDPGLFRSGADRRRSRWAAGLVAAAVVLIAAGMLTAAEMARDDRAATPIATAVTATSTVTAASSAAAGGATDVAPTAAEQMIVCTVPFGVDGAPVTVTLPAESDSSAATVLRTAMTRSDMPMSTMPMSTMPMSTMPMSMMSGSAMPGPGMMRSSAATATADRTPTCAELGYRITVTGCFVTTATVSSDCSDPCPGGWETTWGFETTGSDGQPSADAGGSGYCPGVPSTVASVVSSAAYPGPRQAPQTDGSILPEPPHTVAESTVANPTAAQASVPGG